MARETINCVVMFADVAGSTAMYENMGDELARERISKALNTLISISRRHSGKLVKTIGDEILVYFTDVDMAVSSARTAFGLKCTAPDSCLCFWPNRAWSTPVTS